MILSRKGLIDVSNNEIVRIADNARMILLYS